MLAAKVQDIAQAISRLAVTPIIVTLAACSSQLPLAPSAPIPEFLTSSNTGTFGPRPAIPTPAEIHRLTPEQEQDFLAFMKDRRHTKSRENMLIFEYIERFTANFDYEGLTNTASQTLMLNNGNCMSLAVLTTALAELAGLDMDYQLMDDIPVYEIKGTAVKKGVHIRTIIYDPGFTLEKKVISFYRPGIKIDYFPTNRQRFVSNLERKTYLAMFYQNLAVEALEKANFNKAYWLSMETLNHVPDYSPAINLLAVINRRAGNVAIAESLYLYGIERADEKLSLLKNYMILLKGSGRNQEARRIRNQLATMDDPSPFHWYQLAQSSYDAAEYREAIRFYNKALDLAPYLHEAWLGIANANYAMGRYEMSRRALEAAFEEAEKVSARELYEAKLVSLSQEDDI